MTTREILENYRNIAVVGMSKNPSKTANSVPAYMRNHGYNVIPVNPTTDEIDGVTCYPTLSDVPEKIEIVNVFRPSEDVLPIVQEAVERKKSRGDIDVIWLQEGIYSSEGQTIADENGIVFIQDECIYREHLRLF